MRHATKHGFFEVDPLTGQPQVAVCHGFGVPDGKKGRGYGHLLKQEQMAMLTAHYYDFAICTVAGNNAKQKRILYKAGWRPLAAFRNTRTTEVSELWGSHVASPEVE